MVIVMVIVIVMIVMVIISPADCRVSPTEE